MGTKVKCPKMVRNTDSRDEQKKEKERNGEREREEEDKDNCTHLSLVSFSSPFNPHSIHPCMTTLQCASADVTTPSQSPYRTRRMGRMSHLIITRRTKATTNIVLKHTIALCRLRERERRKERSSFMYVHSTIACTVN